MKKRFIILIAALMLLLTMISQPTRLWGQNTYKLVTDANQLSANDEIIIASGKNATSTPSAITAIGAANNSNNRKAVSVSVSNNIITTTIDNGNETTSGANAANSNLTKPLEITLVSSNSNWNLKEVLSNGNVFLNGGYTSNNKLTADASVSTSTNNKGKNGIWDITINTTSYVATIKNQNNFSVKKNSSSAIFASYGSGQNDVYIYKKAYTVTYDKNGGSGTMTDSNSPYFMNSSVTTKTNEFTRSGYSFNGWNTASDGTGTPYIEGASFTITSNTTLYAQWLAASTDPIITINTPTGGTITVEDDDDNTIANGDQIAEGTSLYISATPNVGYSFGEWSVTETSSGDDVELLYDLDENENAFEMPGVDVTVDATFTKNKYNVAVLSVDDITITASYGVSNTITEGNNADVDYQTSISLNATDLTIGKDYDWKITNSSDVDVTDAVLSGTTVTVPAYYIKIGATMVNTYTVTYDANGGTGDMTDDNSPYRDGAEVTTLTNTFTRANYAFSGWNTAGDGSGASYDEGETFTISGNITLYAQWVPSYTITTSATNGTIEVYQSSKPAGDTVRLKVTPNSGYALVGLKIKKTEGGSDTDIVPEYNNELKRYIFTMPAYGVTVKGVFDATNEVTYDFSAIDFSDWDNGYSERSVSYPIATVTFAAASKQNSGSTIDDIPVTKGSAVSLVMKKSGEVTKKITGATFVCRQWGTKTQTITLHYSTDAGSSYSSTSVTSSNFTISKTDLATGTDAVKITFSSNSNQVGIESATILIKGDAHSITCATGLTGGSISSSPTSASQGELVELTALPAADFALDSWTVTYTAGGETFSIPVTDNKFTMPNFAVNVTASFRSARDLTVQYSINGTIDDGLEQEVTEGGSVGIKGIPDDVTPAGYTFAGWSASPSDLSTLLVADDSYTPSDNVTLYAVFTATKPAQFTLSITTSDFNSTSYAANNNEKTTAANAVSGETMDVKWTSYQVMQSGGMQWQKDNGYIYNSTDLGTIKSFTVTSSEGSFTTLYGTLENDGCSSSTVGNGYFKTRVGGTTGKTSEVKVTFVKSITRKFTRIISKNEDINTTVTLTAPAIIESGQTLTIKNGGILNAGNYLTIDGGTLVIEDGGQLILSDDASVQATVKNSTAASTETKTYDIQWNAISSPVDNVVVTSFVKGDTHNVYRYDEKTVYWQEYRGTNGFNNLQNGRGYIYRSTESGIEFQGEVITGTVSCADYLSYACDNNRYIGFNLIGNPFTHDITWSNLTTKTNISSAGFFLLGSDGNWSAQTNSGTIAPMQAFLVQATEESPVIKISNTAGKGDDRYGNDQIQFTVNNSEYSDVAYAIFREGHGLNKIEHRNDNIPMLYIINDDKDYAIAEMPDNTNVINLGFKARAIGQYTLSLNAEGRYSYMHLYDKLTGSDVDMLLDNSYTFVGSPSDRNDRFVLRLNYNAANIDTESDIFAYQNGADIIISGTGELQIFDIMGHQVSTQRINGVETINVSTQGVYILRLVGTEIKTQKIVVR